MYSPIEKDQQIVDFAQQQWKIFWMPDEIKVEKDIQDILVNMTPSEKHGVITTLKLFTLYELKAGTDYWLGRFMRTNKTAEDHRMAAVFGAFELAVHKPFYEELNKLLHLNTDEFYDSYVQDPTLKARMEFIDDVVSHKDDLVSLAGFSMVEGAILYSSFAFLKHFQSKGKNKLLNVVRGINFSVRDENLHSIAGAYKFKQKLKAANLTPEQQQHLHGIICDMAEQLKQHEFRIIEMIFEMGHIDNITIKQLQNFVLSRLDQCIVELGYPAVYKVSYNPIGLWFYDGINGYQFNDFFSGMGNQYNRSWDEQSFTW
jgi:ribonucleoside-diphosphate reductase beta chain